MVPQAEDIAVEDQSVLSINTSPQAHNLKPYKDLRFGFIIIEVRFYFKIITKYEHGTKTNDLFIFNFFRQGRTSFEAAIRKKKEKSSSQILVDVFKPTLLGGL